MNTSRLRFAFCLAVCFAVAACGPRYGMRVPNLVIEELPYETRIELLEAENDLAAAIDKRDEAENEVNRTRDAIRRAKEREGAAWREVGEAPDNRSREIAELSVQEAQARVEYLRGAQDLNVLNLDLEELALRCAFARFETSRLEVARKAKVRGSEALRPEDFANQLKACEQDLASRKTSREEKQKSFAEVRKVWDDKKQALAQKTFDARASPYVE
ncbi:MAG: hypothetical protein ACKVPX_15170 [Myxococcaceae bacterium]